MAAAFYGFFLLTAPKMLRGPFGDALTMILMSLAGLGTVAGYVDARTSQRARDKRVEIAEDRFRQHPEKPQLAWDLARAKLESYLDRNLGHGRFIFLVTIAVMTCGFAVVVYGLIYAMDHPDHLPVSIVSSVSGVLISFIGGSFLLIYRSIMRQTKDYVSVLERINAVGMALQVIETIPDSSAEIKHATTAGLAKELLGLYGATGSQGKADGRE